MLRRGTTLTDLSSLGAAEKLWTDWCFGPWNDGSASGLHRTLTMVKGGLLGEVGRYCVEDYIVWKYEPGDEERLLKTTKPKNDVMTHRYVFVSEDGEAFSKRRSMWLGVRGFVEVHRYLMGSEPADAIKDIAYMVNAAAGETRKIGDLNPVQDSQS